jgi:hypothetical protein
MRLASVGSIPHNQGVAEDVVTREELDAIVSSR